ncbi:MAG: alanine--glyoxylate aminotransferase family protein [Syntrophomonadaceae bacterium]|nr:alanine--glyoxylate aminotransferase family protein [Syntrophomonadaceae bacterium]MDD3888693.1 alanine--glyoxylate aminotransferase family protein [Syntrophomonadaceae bacterium]MDD4548473.1 alanine--glyoxylate aminotransferase family protein [Syntrophomonadaceae bacterium]
MQGDQFLLLPGPTPVPERVVRAMNRSMINHRGPEFQEILREVTEGVKKVYHTRHNVLMYPSSGTGMMEAAVANFISPGDKVLAISIGVFGDRFAEIAVNFGARVEKIDFPWGQAADPGVIKNRIEQDKNHEIKAVLITHNDTSTGVFNNIKAVREAMGDHPALLMVDSVSGLAAVELRMDEWRIDVAVSGSQKAFMLPPGLGLMAFNDRALQVHQHNTNHRFYWDVTKGLKYLEKGQTAFTPPIALFYGLQEAVRMMLEEGLDNLLTRHKRYRDMVRGAIKAMGLELFAGDAAASTALTAVYAPENIGSNQIRKEMLEKYNIVLAGGQQSLDNVIFRIGHLGYVRELDLLSVLAALEITLIKLGYNLTPGAGVKKAQEFLLDNY